MTRPAVSVLTPTYNRVHVLHRAYDSLARQTMRDFEWVVVDDGSIDNTPALLARWQEEADFPITWLRYTNNRGQIPATNEGRAIVKGEYALKLDSDDALFDDAMATIAEWRQKTGIDSIDNVGGLAFRCVDEFGNIVGRTKKGKSGFYRETIRTTSRAARYRLGINFDVFVVYKREVFSTMSYGELDGSENLPPSIGLNRISDRCELIYIDRPIRIYFRHDAVERLSDKPAKQVKWPRGNYLRALAILNEDIDYFRDNPKVFLGAARRVTRLGLHIGRPLRLRFRDLANRRARMLWVVSIAGGYAGYIRDRLRGSTAPKADPDITAWGPAAPPESPALFPPALRFRR